MFLFFASIFQTKYCLGKDLLLGAVKQALDVQCLECDKDAPYLICTALPCGKFP